MFTFLAVERAGTNERDPIFRAAKQAARAAAAYHRAKLEGLEHLPAGPALLVGNHGLFGWETLTFFYLMHRETGRVPVGMADRRVFGSPPIRDLLFKVGGVPGTRDNALGCLSAGRWVVCYPGGSREVFKAPGQRYRLRWERALGFARLALAANVPVIPFAGLGVDDTFLNLGHVGSIRRRLGRYAVPLAVGLGPLPLPVQLRFRFAAPVTPESAHHRPELLKLLVQRSIEDLLEEHGHPAPAAAEAVP